jgi:hypothetical protein
MDNGDAKHSCEKIAFQYFYSDAPHIISASLARLRDMVADRLLCRALVIRLVTRADHASDMTRALHTRHVGLKSITRKRRLIPVQPVSVQAPESSRHY